MSEKYARITFRFPPKKQVKEGTKWEKEGGLGRGGPVSDMHPTNL